MQNAQHHLPLIGIAVPHNTASALANAAHLAVACTTSYAIGAVCAAGSR